MTLRYDDSLMFRDALDRRMASTPHCAPRWAPASPTCGPRCTRRTAGGDYGFLKLGRQPELVARLTAWRDALRGRFDHLLVLGIGGSARAKALLNALKSPGLELEWDAAHRGGVPTLTVLENVDPVTVQATLARLDPRRTIVNVISKSGGTAETLAQFLIVRQWLEAAVGEAAARDHLVITTDPAKGALRAIVNAEKITAFDVPPDVGGRLLVLTAVGLVPAALLGIDVAGPPAGAEAAVRDADAPDLAGNAAARYAALQWQAQASRAANVHVVMPYSDRLKEFAEWYRQLWAESLEEARPRGPRGVPRPDAGGRGRSHRPALAGAALYRGTVRQDDHLHPGRSTPSASSRSRRAPDSAPNSPTSPASRSAPLDAEMHATREAMRSQGRMTSTLEIDTVDAFHLGRAMMFFQAATGYAGVWYDVDPFDQPGVELGKVLTFKAMGRAGY